MEEKKKKNDLILIGSVVVIALVAYFGITFYQKIVTENPVAVVTIAGEEYGRFDLTKDTVERIELLNGSYNVLVIENGKADIIEASCPDGICVNHRAVHKQKESIVCIPNKVVVEIENGEALDIDMSTN